MTLTQQSLIDLDQLQRMQCICGQFCKYILFACFVIYMKIQNVRIPKYNFKSTVCHYASMPTNVYLLR